METAAQNSEVRVQAGAVELAAFLNVPPDSRGLVIFAHGSGSSRFSPRNQFVAEVLNRAGLSTLLLDLLAPDEHAADEYTRALRFDIRLLSERLTGAVDWAGGQASTRALPIGLFGASTGAAAALQTAAARPERVRAVVSRGGRPDLTGPALEQVRAPTLLIVGGRDTTVIEMNREAAARLRAPYRLETVPGATHLFEEPGTLGEVARLASEWFVEHLG